MYTFQDKKNREDVVALRWPKACLSCGIDMPMDAHPQHGIVGLFHVDKKTTRGDKRHTQVLVKMPGFFYLCKKCTGAVEEFLNSPIEKKHGHDKIAQRILDSPWMEFIELEKTGAVRIPEGVFRRRLQTQNPDAEFRSKECPMRKLGLQRREQ